MKKLREWLANKVPTTERPKAREVYKGSEKSEYTCIFCGTSHSSVEAFLKDKCPKDPYKLHVMEWHEWH